KFWARRSRRLEAASACLWQSGDHSGLLDRLDLVACSEEAPCAGQALFRSERRRPTQDRYYNERFYPHVPTVEGNKV
ncbi:hypothetical protein BT69DRAFT_1285064, partial [Atractiella rhizophila]